jgi:hypothetical protein
MWLLNSEVKEKAYQGPREIAAFFFCVEIDFGPALNPDSD